MVLIYTDFEMSMPAWTLNITRALMNYRLQNPTKNCPFLWTFYANC